MNPPVATFGARAVALRVLRDSDRGRDYAADLLEKELEDDRVQPLDRSLATALVYATVRHQGTLDAILDAFSDVKTPQMDAEMRWVLRLAATQLLFLEKIPPYAVLDQAAEQAKLHKGSRAAGFATGVLRALQRAVSKPDADGPPVAASPAVQTEKQWYRTVPEALDARWPGQAHRRLLAIPGGRRLTFDREIWPDPDHEPVSFLAQMQSHPAWIVKRWLGRYGAAATLAILEAGNRHPEMALRPNRHKCTQEQLVERLRKENIEVDAKRLAVKHTGALWRLESFKDGWFSVQDPAAQLVAPLLQAKPGELVADLCAAPGGKTGQLDESGAKVVAADNDLEKVRGMRRSFSRLGVSAILAAADARNPPFRAAFDGVLVDVPCSNTGVFARRVEARWRLREKDVRVLSQLQRKILLAALAVTKPGGRVVYSTCSLEDEENGTLVREIIRDGNGLRLAEELKILPGPEWTCGGYAARISVMKR